MRDIGFVDGIDSTRSASCKLGRVSMTGDITGESQVVDLFNDEQRFASNKIGGDSMTGDVNDESQVIDFSNDEQIFGVDKTLRSPPTPINHYTRCSTSGKLIHT